MKIRGNGSAVAIVLSVLAVILAGGGTAVAVSSSVSIADPKTPSRMARVDGAGRLTVAGATSSVNSAGYLRAFQNGGVTFVTVPTTASLAVSRIRFDNPTANASAAEQQLELGQYPVTTDGQCDSSSLAVVLGQYDLAPGDDVVDSLAAPLVVAPTGGAKYCLGVRVTYLQTTTTPSFYLSYALTGYVVAGSYTAATAPAGSQPRSAKIGS